jgi:hypothetical protein
LPGKSVTSASATRRLSEVERSTPWSGVPKVTPSSGLAMTSSSAMTGNANSAGRRVTRPARRPHHGEAAPSAARVHGTRPALTRGPSTASRAGSSTSAPNAAIATTPMPAYPKERRK